MTKKRPEPCADWRQRLATLVRRARVGSQADLAMVSEISDRTIGLIESSQLKNLPRPETLMRLAIATGSNAKEWLSIIGEEMDEERFRGLQSLMESRMVPNRYPQNSLVECLNGIREELKRIADNLEGRSTGRRKEILDNEDDE